MRVGAADTEGRDGGTSGTAGVGPFLTLGQQAYRARRPVHPRRRLVHVKGRRHDPVPQRLHHLDHTGHTRSRLRMTQVRLHRPQPQRPARHPAPARRWPAAPAPRSGHPAACPYRAPPPHPHRTPTIPRSTGPRGSRAAATGRSAPSARSTHRPDSPPTHAPPPAPGDHAHGRPTAAPPAAHRHPHPTRYRPHPPRTPCTGRPRQTTLTVELGEDVRGGHHRHAAGQRHVALPALRDCTARCNATREDEQAVSTVTAGPSSPRT